MKAMLLKLINEFNKLKSDKDRFRFLLEHKGVFKLNLDNDDTFTTVSDATFTLSIVPPLISAVVIVPRFVHVLPEASIV